MKYSRSDILVGIVVTIFVLFALILFLGLCAEEYATWDYMNHMRGN